MPGKHQHQCELDWPDEGDPPTAAEQHAAWRLDFIADELDRAALYPDDLAWHVSTALDSARNHGTKSMTVCECEALLRAITRVRPAVVAALPQISHARVLTALDALSTLALICSGCDVFGDARDAEACRMRMRIGQNEAHNRSLLADIRAGKLRPTLRHLQRIAENERANVTLMAKISLPTRPPAHPQLILWC